MRVAYSGEWECELKEFLSQYRRQRANRRLARRYVKRSSAMWLRYTAISLFALIVLRVSFVEAFFVPSASMAPTLQPHDYILVPKFIYGLQLPLWDKPLASWGAPKRGDIVVFRMSRQRESGGFSASLMVKRVVGLEGDIVEILAGQVYLNGVPLIEPYLKAAPAVSEGYHFGPHRVPSGKMFVLGDNRDNSEDSRFWVDPFVAASQVLGPAVMVYWSTVASDRSGTVLR